MSLSDLSPEERAVSTDPAGFGPYASESVELLIEDLRRRAERYAPNDSSLLMTAAADRLEVLSASSDERATAPGGDYDAAHTAIILAAAKDVQGLASTGNFLLRYFKDRLALHFSKSFALGAKSAAPTPGSAGQDREREREAIKDLRRTFEVGASFGQRHPEYSKTGIKAEAERRYPLPLVERPRIIRDPDGITGKYGHGAEWGAPREWRCVGGQLQSRTVGVRLVGAEMYPYPWQTATQCRVTPRRAKLWADLLANPTELVDDEGAADSSAVARGDQ